jgi:hypothetical protein
MKVRIVFFIIIVCGFATSCSYYPRSVGIPLIREKGDTRVEGGLGLLQASLQASFSQGVTEKIAYQVVASIDPNGPGDKSGLYIGYYKNIEERNVLELYGGFAYGRSSARNGSFPGYLNSNYQLYFTQLNYGFIEKKKANFESGLGLKFGLLHSKVADVNYFVVRQDDQFGEPSPVYRMNGAIVEPTVFLRFGGERLKFQTAIGFSKYFQYNHRDKEVPANALCIGIGISYSFRAFSN